LKKRNKKNIRLAIYNGGKNIMEKPYLNIRELSIVLGQGRRCAETVMKDLRKIAKEKNYYIPETHRDILIPTHLVKEVLKIKEIKLD